MEGDGVCVPVVGIFFEADSVKETPFFKEERAVSDEMSGLGGPVGVGFDRFAMDRQVGGEGAEIEEVRGGVLEDDAQGEWVGGRDAEGFGLIDAAFVEGFCVKDGVELRGVFASCFRAKGADPRVAEIFGGDGIAVCPCRVRAEMECVRFAVGGDVPSFGDAWEDSCGF